MNPKKKFHGGTRVSGEWAAACRKAELHLDAVPLQVNDRISSDVDLSFGLQVTCVQ